MLAVGALEKRDRLPAEFPASGGDSRINFRTSSVLSLARLPKQIPRKADDPKLLARDEKAILERDGH